MSSATQANFLSWHRFFTYTYEQALRNECGYQGYQPYWNVSSTKSWLVLGSWSAEWTSGENPPSTRSILLTLMAVIPAWAEMVCLKHIMRLRLYRMDWIQHRLGKVEGVSRTGLSRSMLTSLRPLAPYKILLTQDTVPVWQWILDPLHLPSRSQRLCLKLATGSTITLGA